MPYISNILFAALLAIGIGFFVKNIKRLRRNIFLGRPVAIEGDKKLRWKNMIYIALGQSKMITRPISGFLHIVVYIGFIIINIEIVEIVLDGLIPNSHRLFSPLLGKSIYAFLIGSFEVLALLVLVSVIIFWIRRNTIKIKRFWYNEMKGWPKKDANIILYFEIVLMSLFLIMNASDVSFQNINAGNIVSQHIAVWFSSMSESSLHLLERTAWWLHIIGILVFLNYLYYSKHLHILLAFPNTFYGKLTPKGKLDNLETVTKEVKLMMNPEADVFSTPAEGEEQIPEKFGASDVMDLTWVQLMNAYSCTECGRCSSVCPANITGKKLSPRKIMMDTRDRLEEVGNNLLKNKGKFVEDNKQLLGNYISKEELWACTSCNACVEACPISIDPLSIIIDMRRFLVMEQSSAPSDLNNMMTNIENNGAPWPFNQMDKLNWSNE